MLEVAIKKQRRGMTVEAEFSCTAGEALGLFGPSGAGKSTVLSCIAGLEKPDTGQVRFAGETWYPPAKPVAERALGYLTQHPHLFPHLSVGQNVAFSLARGADPAWVKQLRERLQLEDIWTAPATGVSAGQARRVALARMLARRPKLVLLDEPFAGLDRGLVRGLLDDLEAWRRELGFTLIVVDHQAEILQRLSSRVLAMESGRVVAQGSWELLGRLSGGALPELLRPL